MVIFVMFFIWIIILVQGLRGSLSPPLTAVRGDGEEPSGFIFRDLCALPRRCSLPDGRKGNKRPDRDVGFRCQGRAGKAQQTVHESRSVGSSRLWPMRSRQAKQLLRQWRDPRRPSSRRLKGRALAHRGKLGDQTAHERAQVYPGQRVLTC